eukprot:550128-Amphidinium_carterae.4
MQSVAKKGLMSIPGHPSTFVLPEEKADIKALKHLPLISTLLVVYVDDLLFCGRRAKLVFVMLSDEVDLLDRESEGSQRKNALSHVMKAMYVARMEAPQLVLLINRLSSQVTRWTKTNDQALSQIVRDMFVNEAARDARNCDDMHIASQTLTCQGIN